MSSIVLNVGIVALCYLVGGVTLTGFSGLILINPDFLKTYRISFLGQQIINPSHVFLWTLIPGLVIGMIGIILSGFIFYMVKAIQIMAKGLFIECDSKPK